MRKITGILLLTMFIVMTGIPTIKICADDVEGEEAYIQISDDDITLHVGEKYDIEYDFEGTDEIHWKSSKKAVATVNGKGRVFAKKPGKTKITVQSGNNKDSIIVTVKRNASYKQIAKKMKKYAKKHKGYSFENDKKTGKCRLYGTSFNFEDISKLRSKGLGFLCTSRSYMELSKRKGKPQIKLVIWDDMIALSKRKAHMVPKKLKIQATNGSLKFSLKKLSKIYRYNDGVYSSLSKSEAVISSNKKEGDLEKYRKMLKQKSFKPKYYFNKRIYFWTNLSVTQRKNWKKLVDFYQEQLERIN